MNDNIFQNLADELTWDPIDTDEMSQSVSDDNIHSVDRFAGSAMAVGIVRLRAGYRDANEWFTRSVQYKLAALKWGLQQNPPWESPFHSFKALSAVLLANNENLFADVIDVVTQIEEVSGDDPMNTAMRAVVDCLVALLSDDGRFEQAVDELRTVVDQHKDTDGFQALDADTTRRYVSYAQFMEAIRDGNREAITDAIELMLEYHDEEVFDDSEEDHTCIDATILTILARRKGFDVEVESEYIPENLPE